VVLKLGVEVALSPEWIDPDVAFVLDAADPDVIFTLPVSMEVAFIDADKLEVAGALLAVVLLTPLVEIPPEVEFTTGPVFELLSVRFTPLVETFALPVGIEVAKEVKLVLEDKLVATLPVLLAVELALTLLSGISDDELELAVAFKLAEGARVVEFKAVDSVEPVAADEMMEDAFVED